MKGFLLKSAAAALAAAFFCLGSGCTEQERMGVSPIPQNSPASWELQPYGPVRN